MILKFEVYDLKRKMYFEVIEINLENSNNTLRYIRCDNSKRLYVNHDEFELFQLTVEGERVSIFKSEKKC